MNQDLLLRHASARCRTEPPSTLHGAMVMFRLGLRELVLSKKTLVMVFLGALLTFASVSYAVLKALGIAPKANIPLVFGFLVTTSFLRFLLPVVALFYGAALVTDEVDGRTLTYLTTRPLDKRIILWGKFCAFATVATVVLEVTLVMCWLALATSQGPQGLLTHLHLLAKDGVVVVLGVLSYGALFTLLGTVLRKPVIPGLVFIFVWEQLVSFLPGTIQRLTILHFLQALTPHRMAPDSEIPFLSALFVTENPILALVVLASFAATFLAMAGQVFKLREYHMEK